MIIAINAVENIRNAETVVDPAALEPGGGKHKKRKLARRKWRDILEDPVPEVAVGVPERETVVSTEDETGGEGPVPDPPAAADNWANPTEFGEVRNTEYTFF